MEEHDPALRLEWKKEAPSYRLSEDLNMFYRS
jgi:hypothetical protein